METFKARCEARLTSRAPEIRKALRPYLKNGFLLPHRESEHLCQNFADGDQHLWMVMLAASVESLFRPPISNFSVVVVGRERETGDLLLGRNLEFKGAPLAFTIHAEQFLLTRAWNRGHTVDFFALAKPFPCGHCRQFLLEFADGGNLRFINLKGTELNIRDITPFSFGPEQLNHKGLVPGGRARLAKPKASSLLHQAAWSAACRSHAPYSKSPAGVALQVSDGTIWQGSYLENAAFNPSLSALASGLIEVAAAGRSWKEISRAVLVQSPRALEHASLTRYLLKTIAPKASLTVADLK